MDPKPGTIVGTDSIFSKDSIQRILYPFGHTYGNLASRVKSTTSIDSGVL